jgi:putative ABC transport system permease protein
MLHLLIKSTLRLLSRNVGMSVLKITGLAVGSAVFLLTTHFCLDEIHYDNFHPDADLIYRYVHRVKSDEDMQSFAMTNALTGSALKERYPEVHDFCRMVVPPLSVRNPRTDIGFNERHFAFADSNFLSMFHFPLSNGNRQALREPLSVVLTPSMAKKYFGDEDPVGKTLIVAGELEFIVRGVFQEDFRMSHFNFDFVASFSSLDVFKNNPRIANQIPASLNLEKKGFNAFYTYLKLAPGSAAELEAKLPAFIEDFRGKGRSERLKPTLQSMRSIHLESNLLYEIDLNGSTLLVYVYFFVGALVLLVACINYVNISTAELLNRAKGIGLKKILGVTRSSLIVNHLGETGVITALSLGVGASLVIIASPLFNTMVNRNILFLDSTGWLLLAGIFFVTVLLAGLYPSFVIARARGLEAFRGTIHVSRASLILRNALVFFQLLVSFCLVTISLLIYFQLDLLLHKDPGFDSDQVIAVNAVAVTAEQRILFKEKLITLNGVEEVGMCSTPPGEALFSYGLTLPEHQGDEDKRVLVYQSYIDANYLKALGVALDSGRMFDPTNGADSTQYIVINSAMVDAMGPAVQTRTLNLPGLVGDPSKKSVIGVFNNFSFASFHRAIDPLMLEYNPRQCRYYLIRFRGDGAAEVVKAIQKAWRENLPTLPLDYEFIDQRFARFYDAEQCQKSIIASFAVLAIGLAALGIFGTTLFVVRRRTKEVGIRKMLGSARLDLFTLLARPLLLLVAVASIAGVPPALYFGARWLEQYPYKIYFSPLLFLTAFGVMLVIVMGTIVYHFVKVTRVNPVEVLRNDS